MIKVLLTGSAGYLGTHVLRALVDHGVSVLAVQRRGEVTSSQVETIHCDFGSLDVNGLTRLGPIDRVLHLAWSDGFNHNARSHIDHLATHVQFARNVAEAGIPHFAGMGSMHEIGYWEGAINENTPTAPRSMYGIAKNALREAARLVTEQADGFFQWLRGYYILGDDQRNHSLFTKILTWEAEGKTTFPFNSGKSLYDFIDVQTLADQIVCSTLQPTIGGVIECCSGKPVALRDKVEEFIARHSLNIRPEYGAFPERPYDSPGIWGDSTKIDQILLKARTYPEHDRN